MEGFNFMSKEVLNDDGIIIKKKGHALRNIIIFLLFMGIGVAIGIYGTTKYLESREVDEPDDTEIQNGPDDITKDEQTKELVDSLYAMLNKDPMFYSAKGVSTRTMDNTTKLTYIYKYLLANNNGTTESIDVPWMGSSTCENDFLLDASTEANPYPTQCTVTKISRSLFSETNKKLFNDTLLDTSVEFRPTNAIKCVVDTVDNNNYICGNVANESGITGELESRFTIQKVTRDDDGTIAIYEKGYLIDKRSTVLNENSQYDNYYLHSSDSNQYYFELKNADNLTFKHTFKSEDRLNYYYVGTELVK